MPTMMLKTLVKLSMPTQIGSVDMWTLGMNEIVFQKMCCKFQTVIIRSYSINRVLRLL